MKRKIEQWPALARYSNARDSRLVSAYNSSGRTIMKTEQYKLKRRLASQGMRTRTQFKEDVIDSLKHKGILFLTAALLIMCAFSHILYKRNSSAVADFNKKNASVIAELHAEKEKTIRFSGMLATVMNGGTLFDKNSDTAFFFHKPTQFKIRSLK